tara:strand:- start:4252 stop:4656 length:405 start_codon:yes stop_codon:yes gene_type:complete
MPDLHITHNTFFESCSNCGESYDSGKNGYIFNFRALDTRDSKKVWKAACPHCKTWNEIPLETNPNYTTVYGTRPPKARGKIWGSPNKRIGRDKWAGHPPDLEKALAEERRLRELNNGEKETVQHEREEDDTSKK